MKLYVFAICEKVIVDQGKVPSLIGLFNKIIANVQEDAPPNAVAQKEFAIFTAWEQEADDINKPYRQVYEVFTPNGTQFGEPVTINIAPAPGRLNFTVLAGQGIPIGESGFITIKSRLENLEGEVIYPAAPIRFEIEVHKVAKPA